MVENAPTKKTCPSCGGSNYQFRSRKNVADENGEAVETKYRCKGCGHEWKVRVRRPA